MSLILNSKEERAFREQRLVIDCLRMELRRQSDGQLDYQGAGEIRQSPDGALQFVLYDTVKVPHSSSPDGIYFMSADGELQPDSGSAPNTSTS